MLCRQLLYIKFLALSKWAIFYFFYWLRQASFLSWPQLCTILSPTSRIFRVRIFIIVPCDLIIFIHLYLHNSYNTYTHFYILHLIGQIKNKTTKIKCKSLLKINEWFLTAVRFISVVVSHNLPEAIRAINAQALFRL